MYVQIHLLVVMGWAGKYWGDPLGGIAHPGPLGCGSPACPSTQPCGLWLTEAGGSWSQQVRSLSSVAAQTASRQMATRHVWQRLQWLQRRRWWKRGSWYGNRREAPRLKSWFWSFRRRHSGKCGFVFVLFFCFPLQVSCAICWNASFVYVLFLGTFCWIRNAKEGSGALWPVGKKPGNCRCPLRKESRCPEGHETIQWNPTWWYDAPFSLLERPTKWQKKYFLAWQLTLCFCFIRATNEHPTCNITDWHTEATHAGVCEVLLLTWTVAPYVSNTTCNECYCFQSKQRWRRHEQRSRWLWRHAARPRRTWRRRTTRPGARWSRWRQTAAVSRGTRRPVRRLQCQGAFSRC